jgi:hypothetical protein
MSDRLVRWMPLALVCGALAWIAQKSAQPISDPDDWWHLRLGNDLIAQHSLAAPAHWSVFATESWVPTEPVPEVVSAYVERWFGLPGLAVLFSLFAMLVAVVVHLTNRREAAPLPAAVATVFAVLAGSGSLTSRPQLVSFLLLPILLAAWLQTDRDLKPRWWLVPLMWFWSLCHGFWFLGAGLGLAVVVGIAVSRRADLVTLAKLAGVAVGCFAVVALNPVGLGVFEAPFAVQSTSAYITEWQRTDLLLPGPLGAVAMIVVTAVVWVVTRERVTVARVLLLLASAFFLWYAVRLVIVAGLVAAPLFAGALDTLVRRAGDPGDSGAPGEPGDPGEAHQRGPGRTEVRVLVAALLVGVVAVGCAAPVTADEPADVPVAFDPALDRLPAGTVVFNAYELGGWVSWRHPDLEQYIDGLITPYPPQHAEDFHRAEIQGPGWYRVVRDSHAPVAVLATQSALAAALQGKGWTPAGTDAGYVLLEAPGRAGGR